MELTGLRQRRPDEGPPGPRGSPDSPTPSSPPSWARRLYALLHACFPLFIMVTAPNFVMALWYGAVHCGGSYLRLGQFYSESGGVLAGQYKIWAMTPIFTPFSLYVLGGFTVWGLLTMRVLPGKRIFGPETPTGHVPQYKDNGFLCYVATMAAFGALAVCLKLRGSSVTIVYDRFNELLATVNVFAIFFCFFLYLKGIWAPSTPDHSASGNFLFDYYWGTELYPRVFGFDLKVWTNCRFGMTAWPLLICIFALKSFELDGLRNSVLVTTALQMFYLTKFFWWEGGYYSTMDIILDRAGFYICWGCLVFVPGFYASVSLAMVSLPTTVGSVYSGVLFAAGLICLYVNYDADAQKSYVRDRGGKCSVWGQPARVIAAKYKLSSGVERSSILVASGYWGLSRHFHYIPEICLSFCWCAAAGCSSVMPFSYAIFIVMLLIHRSFRDDWKCRVKYGRYWEKYCELVPHKIVPKVF